MAQAPRDQNQVTALLGTSSVDGVTPVAIWADPITHRLLVDASGTTIGLTVGSTTISGGTTTRILYDNAGVLGELSVVPVTSGGTGTTTQFTSGSVVFAGASGVYTQDNTNFNYNSTSKTLTLDSSGTNTSIHTGPAAGTSNATVGGVGQEFIGTNNTTGGVNLILGNINAGTSAFVDIFLQNNLADNTGTHYGVVNLNSSTYSDTSFGTAVAVANQMSIYGTDGPTMVGSFKASTGAVNFIVGGSASTNEVGRFTTLGLTVGLTGTLTGAIKFSGATSTSITLQGQAVGASGVLTLPAVTDTIAVLAASQAFTNKTYNGNTVTSGTGTLTLSTFTLTVAGTASVSGTNTGDQTTVSGNAGTATALQNVRTIWGQNFDGTGNVTGSLTAVTNITGGASSMTITAGTGNSRTLALQSTTSGGTATTFLTGNADQTVTFAAGATLAGNTTIGTGNAFTCGTIELGAASDTTLARVSAGVISVEGVTVATSSNTLTFTNKRRTRRVVTVNNPGATPTTNTDNNDVAAFTGCANAITSMTTNLSGTPVATDLLEVQLTDNGTARAITWGASFVATTVALPTTTVISTLLRVFFEYNGSAWACVGTA